MYYGIGGLEMAVYRLLDVVLAKAPSEWMKSPPGGPLYGAYIVADEPTKNSAGMTGETNVIDRCRMGKVRPTEARKTDGIGGLEMAVYRLLDVVLAKAPSEWMKSPPGGPL